MPRAAPVTTATGLTAATSATATAAVRSRTRRVEQRPALVGARSRGVTQHAVGRYRPHPLGAQRGSRVPSGSVHPASASSSRTARGIDGQHQRGLRPPGVRVTARGGGPPHEHVVALGGAARAAAGPGPPRCPPWALTTTTPAKEPRAERTSSTRRPASTSWPTSSVPGNPACSPLAPYATAGATGDTGTRAAGQPRGHGDGDAGVGVEREVRPVLLERAERHGQDGRPPVASTSGQVAPPRSTPLRRGPASGSGRAWAPGPASRPGRPWSGRGPACGRVAPRRQRRLAVPVHALGVRSVERQAGEELGRHAAALAGVVGAAGRAGPGALRLAQRGEQRRLAPDGGEAPGVADVAGQELAVDDEGAGVDVADRVDQAHHPPGPAEVQPVERLAEGREVEEGVAGQHAGALQQPVVERALLRRRRVQRRPRCRRPGPRGAGRVSRSWAP